MNVDASVFISDSPIAGELSIWDLYYAAVMTSVQGVGNSTRSETEYAAKVADAMVNERRLRVDAAAERAKQWNGG